jgi:hypothetical protein
MTVRRPWCQAHLIFQIDCTKRLHRPSKPHCVKAWFALYSVAMEPAKPPSKPESNDLVSRRTFGGKLVYVPPTVLAVIRATERPALAGGLPI